MFGKGIYFADVSSKSANYCHASKENPKGILLLCEIALGEIKKVVKAKDFLKPPEYCTSVMGVGLTAPDPKKEIDFTKYSPSSTNLKFRNGELVPNPELTEISENNESELRFNEYIIYNDSQCRIKYMVECTFNFK